MTIDPPGSRDLDQALHIERRGDGHRVRYAIADVGAFVDARRRARPRGPRARRHGLRARREGAAAPAGAVRGRGEPAARASGARRCCGRSTSTRRRADRDRRRTRAQVRSGAQHTYADVPAALAPLLREVGERRLALERARGGVRLAVPEQEVVEQDGGWTVRYRVPLAERGAQRPDLAADRDGRGGADARAGTGDPAHPAARRTSAALARLRRQAAALGVEWPADLPYPEFVRGLDPATAAHAAVMHEATGVGARRGLHGVRRRAARPTPAHFAVAAPYAHATAPLRRLQDRYVAECCLAACAGTPAPDWVRAALPDLPAAMAAGAHARATRSSAASSTSSRRCCSPGREGERFDAVVIDDGLVQLGDPAVRARLATAARAGQRGHGAPRARRSGHPDRRVLARLNTRSGLLSGSGAGTAR